MKTPDIELEMHFQVWDNRSGIRFELGPDKDGLGCIELKYIEDDNEEKQSMMFDLETAKCLHTALGKLIAERAEKESVNLDSRE